MNDRWIKNNGFRTNTPERVRIARRFRYHVRTPKNPKGRIRREPCFHCGDETKTEAHHVDYVHPFLVLWVCFSCHRKVDHGSLNFGDADVWDYTSLIRQRPQTTVEALSQQPEGVPF